MFIIGLISATMNLVVTASISFTCAIQVESFRKINGNAMATTMCTGNLRTATEMLSVYRKGNDRNVLVKSIRY